MKPNELRELPFPDCSKDCEAIEYFGAGECDSICSEKFPEEENEKSLFFNLTNILL